MFKFLHKPYPFNDDLKYNAKLILFISIGILLFLQVYEPIEHSSLSQMRIIYLFAGIVASTFLTLTLSLIVVPSLFPKFFNTNNWDIKREIIWNLWIMLAISSIDFLFYTKLFGIMVINFSDIIKIIFLGMLPVAVLITINQDRLLRSHLESARQLNKKLIEKREKIERLIYFKSDYKDEIAIKPSSLILIRSSDNYIEIFYERENEVRQKMVRTTLTNAEELTSEHDFLFRCHRQFIVNINQIKEIEGNSQGYKLFLERLDFPVLVSQKHIEEFKKLI